MWKRTASMNEHVLKKWLDSFRLTINSDDIPKKNTFTPSSVKSWLSIRSWENFEFASIYIAIYNDRFLAPLFSTQTISQHTTPIKIGSNTQCAPKDSNDIGPHTVHIKHIVLRCSSWSRPRYYSELHSTHFLRTRKKFMQISDPSDDQEVRLSVAKCILHNRFMWKFKIYRANSCKLYCTRAKFDCQALFWISM